MPELKLLTRENGSFSVYYERDGVDAHYVVFDSLDLLALTPGGSEFHGSPHTCIEWVKDRMHNLGKIAKERNELRAQRDDLLTACEAIGTKIGKMSWYNGSYTCLMCGHAARDFESITHHERCEWGKALAAITTARGETPNA